MSQQSQIDPEHWRISDVMAIQPGNLSLSATAKQNINKCRQYLNEKVKDGKLYYGINTGFGSLCNVAIAPEDIQQLQHNLVLSHACGMGPAIDDKLVQLMLLLKVKNFVYGNSGASVEVTQRLVDMYNANMLPIVYRYGSLGASGDLAPLAHLCMPIIGEGGVKLNGHQMPTADALANLGWQKINLQSKEGLALLNGTQFMSAHGVLAVHKAKRLLRWANIIGALSADVWLCVDSPFDALVHDVRAHAGQVQVAADIRQLLQGSELQALPKSQVQDPYSFRCMPQVHGSTADVITRVEQIVEQEINSVTDNPLVFPDEDKIISGGNFHGQVLALHLDYLAIAVAELGNISERRTYQLISGERNLPPYLIKDGGLNSGMMIPQYTAAGLVSANKQLCTPASVDSIVSSNGQEDHVSMGANAAVQLMEVVDNVERILAIELLNAAQALHLRAPLKSSPYLQTVVDALRQNVAPLTTDRWLRKDIESTRQFIANYKLS
ncbi:MAG: histidine ammonia-lyase [Bacteroidota bacterium]|jgi:histidine ammonia-lyase